MKPAQPIQQTKLSFHSSLPNGKNEESWLLTGSGPSRRKQINSFISLCGREIEKNFIWLKAGGRAALFIEWNWLVDGFLWVVGYGRSSANGSAKRRKQANQPINEWNEGKKGNERRESNASGSSIGMKRQLNGADCFALLEWSTNELTRGGKSTQSIFVLLARSAPSKTKKRLKLKGWGPPRPAQLTFLHSTKNQFFFFVSLRKKWNKKKIL